jgi:molecular chaperone DnaK (HSP70)
MSSVPPMQIALIIAPVTSIVLLSDMKERDVDEIVLVGGTTRIPKIKEQLRYELYRMRYA